MVAEFSRCAITADKNKKEGDQGWLKQTLMFLENCS